MSVDSPWPGVARPGCARDVLLAAVELAKFGVGLVAGWWAVLLIWVAVDGIAVALGIGAAVAAVAVLAVRRGEWNLLVGFGTSSWLATCFVLAVSAVSMP